MTKIPPPLFLERAALGELSDAELTKARSAYANFDEEVQALKRANTDFLKAHPPSAYVPRLKNEAALLPSLSSPAPRFAWPQLLLPAGAMAAAAVVLIMVMPASLIQGPQERTKGSERAHLIVHRAQDKARLLDGDVAKPGDRLQLAYQSAGAAYGVILSQDGNGAITQHFPKGSTIAGRLHKERTALAESYILDDAPRYERFYFISAERTFKVSDVKSALKKKKPGTALSFPNAQVQSFTLRK